MLCGLKADTRKQAGQIHPKEIYSQTFTEYSDPINTYWYSLSC